MTSKRVWFITGASRGMGVDFANAALAAGHAVVATARDSSRVSQALGQSDDLLAVKLDVTSRVEAEAAVRTAVERFGRIDVLINNAGGFVKRSPIVDADDDYIDAVFRLNARSVVAVSRRVIPLMAANGGGAIINVTTQAARTGGGPGAGLYAACKGFVSTITRTMAKELVKDKIRVNAVAPGVIETPFHDGHSSPEVLKNFANAIPMGRLGTAQECVGAFLFLASEAASGYITGQVIEVNGGQVMP
jgi:3-oxoacyl-[acyl-carrier protein] reductase